MQTLSGRWVVPTNWESPALLDIAIGLGRMPRFGGQTRRWWTVLHHSIVTFWIMQRQGGDSHVLLHTLLHDAHEAVTADIPTTWKLAGNRTMQEQLDLRISESLLIPPSTEAQRERIALVDKAALLAEGSVVGPQGFEAIYPGAIEEDREVVRNVLNWYPGPEYTDGAKSKAVEEFVRMVKSHQRDLHQL
jgi:hypothetical protein